ncbi:hypothetical protein IWX90DRAFT_162637 [Phyllosticta citrichinensis]|uniref:Centrosomin N-terminal motif 1 domain-containing protein n=1 Tax=Phyllosticta citrichinensis TaxID=1130410 RepID=A0ABR1Y0H4_9PEZI
MSHSNHDHALDADFSSRRDSASPDFAPREPSSDYLRQKLRERRLGVDDRPLRSLSLSNPQPVATMDDYIFANDDSKKDRRRSRASGARRSSLQPNGSASQNQNPAMASKEVQSTMDKLTNENFDLKLRLRLMEQKNHGLQEQLEHEQEKTERLVEAAAERDDLEEENADLCARVEELQESVLNTEQKLLDSWKMNSEVIRELEKRDADIKEALDMYLDAENRLQALEQKYTACKLRRDSSYFSNDADAASTSKTLESPRTPKRAPSKSISNGHSPMSRKQRSASTPIRNGQLSGRYHKLVRTISVSEIKTNELRRQASVVAIAEQDDESHTAHTPERRPRGLRRLSATPQYDQMSVSSYKTSSSERSRGLRMKFLEGEQNDDTDSSPSTKPWSTSVSPHSRTPRQLKNSSRHMPTPSTWDTSHRRANEETESVASSDLPAPSETSAEDDTTVIHGEPSTEEDVSTPTLTIPTEYHPGHYPKWPGTPGKHFRASNMLFDGDGVDQIPRTRRR